MPANVLHSNDDEMKTRFSKTIDFGEQLMKALENEAEKDKRTFGAYVRLLLESHPARPKAKAKVKK